MGTHDANVRPHNARAHAAYPGDGDSSGSGSSVDNTGGSAGGGDVTVAVAERALHTLRARRASTAPEVTMVVINRPP